MAKEGLLSQAKHPFPAQRQLTARHSNHALFDQTLGFDQKLDEGQVVQLIYIRINFIDCEN